MTAASSRRRVASSDGKQIIAWDVDARLPRAARTIGCSWGLALAPAGDRVLATAGHATVLSMDTLEVIGVGNQEAFQLLFNASGLFYALTYLVMFGIPLFGLRGITPKPPWWLRIAAGSGFAMTLLYVSLAVFPIISVANPMSFTIKVTAMIVIANAVGIGVFLFGKKRRRAE